jgi:hypothetical protein
MNEAERRRQQSLRKTYLESDSRLGTRSANVSPIPSTAINKTPNAQNGLD